jgi:hypothetical protein
MQISYQAISKQSNTLAAVQDIYTQLHDAQTDVILFFCSSQYDLPVLAKEMQRVFADVLCIGCTTAGEFAGEGYETNSITALGLHRDYFQVSCRYVENMQGFTLIEAQDVMQQLLADMRPKALAPVESQSFIISLLDGLSALEEEFLITFDMATKGIPHFGGSAGDDIDLDSTYIYYDGEFRSAAAIVLLVNTTQKFSVFSVNHVDHSLAKLVVTDADPKTRQVFEINGYPAAEVYADTLNVSVDDLEAELFSIHPLAVKVRGEYYIRSIQRVNKDFNSLSFYCAVDVGIVLNEVSLRDINEPLANALAENELHFGKPSFVLGCDCFLRRLEEMTKGTGQAIAALHRQYNMIGFNAYGEHVNGVHLNQTFTGVYISQEHFNA